MCDVVTGGEGEAEAAGVAFARHLQGHDLVGHDAQPVAAAIVVAADFGFDNQHLVGFEVVGTVFQRVAADHDFNLSAQIFEADEGDFAALAHHGAHGGHESGEAHAVLRFQTA